MFKYPSIWKITNRIVNKHNEPSDGLGKAEHNSENFHWKLWNEEVLQVSKWRQYTQPVGCIRKLRYFCCWNFLGFPLVNFCSYIYWTSNFAITAQVCLWEFNKRFDNVMYWKENWLYYGAYKNDFFFLHFFFIEREIFTVFLTSLVKPSLMPGMFTRNHKYTPHHQPNVGSQCKKVFR